MAIDYMCHIKQASRSMTAPPMFIIGREYAIETCMEACIENEMNTHKWQHLLVFVFVWIVNDVLNATLERQKYSIVMRDYWEELYMKDAISSPRSSSIDSWGIYCIVLHIGYIMHQVVKKIFIRSTKSELPRIVSLYFINVCSNDRWRVCI